MKKMNILLLAFEGGESILLGHLAQRFKRHGAKIKIVFCDHYSVTNPNQKVYSYLCNLGLKGSDFLSLEQAFIEINKFPVNSTEEIVDWEYLKQYDHSNPPFLCNELVHLDPTISNTYHNRKIYYLPDNKNLTFKYAEILLKFVEKTLNLEQFDFIFTVNNQYFLKAAFYSFSKLKRIPYYVFSTSRISDLYIISDNFLLGTTDKIKNEINILQERKDACYDAKLFIKEFKENRKPLYKDFEETLLTITTLMKLRVRLKEFLIYFSKGLRKSIFFTRSFRGIGKKDFFLPSYLQTLSIMFHSLMARILYFRNKKFLLNKFKEKNYLFYAMHLIPENSVLTLSDVYNEMECIFQLSRILPSDWLIIVKANPNMFVSIDHHPNSYYHKINSLPNVIIADPRIPGSRLVDFCKAVAAITGTAVLEGAILGKPGIRWGKTEFDIVSLVTKFSGKDSIDFICKEHNNPNVEFYIQAVYNYGVKVDLRKITCPRPDGEKGKSFDLKIEEVFDSILREHFTVGK